MPGDVTLAAVRVFVALVAAAAAVAFVARRAGVPASIPLVLLGLVVAAIQPGADVRMTPELVLAVLLPGLVFEAAYHTPFEELRRALLAVLLLAIPGVVVIAGVVAVVLNVATGLDVRLGFLIGAMVAATDPAAVISTFERLRTPRGLTTLVEAESLLNDGTGIVLFSIALAALTSGDSGGPAGGVIAFTWVIAASVAIGVIAGLAASVALAAVNDHQIELAISLVLAYGSYLIADAVHLSGIIASVLAGITLGTYGRTHGLSPRAREAIDVVWDFIAFLLTALVFLLIGLTITLSDLASAALPIAWGVVAILGGRALVVYGLLGGTGRLVGVLRRGRTVGPPLPWLHVMFWAGLRGAVSVALALSLPADLEQRGLIQDVTFGIVLFTLVVQGLTAGSVVRLALGRREPPLHGAERARSLRDEAGS
ncbi:MAG TPA: cation:proton antiporter [Candidatus Limnocylindrales bacterium]